MNDFAHFLSIYFYLLIWISGSKTNWPLLPWSGNIMYQRPSFDYWKLVYLHDSKASNRYNVLESIGNNVVLMVTGVEKIVGWALSHHFMHCSEDSSKESKLVISTQRYTLFVHFCQHYQQIESTRLLEMQHWKND